MSQPGARCQECGGAFTADEWERRHTPSGDPLADVHDRCCPDEPPAPPEES